jgi:ABC-2 type transport system permease protein
VRQGQFQISLYSCFQVLQFGVFSVKLSVAGHLVKKISLPRELFPLASVGGAIFNFLIQLTLLVGVTFLIGRPPLWENILYPIAAISLIVILGTALSLLLAALNVYLRDVQHLVEVLLLILFWCSPIVYSPALVHAAIGGTFLEEIYFANPVTLAAVGMQRGMWSAGISDSSQYWPPNLAIQLALACLISVVFMWLAQRIFSRLEGNFAQEI